MKNIKLWNGIYLNYEKDFWIILGYQWKKRKLVQIKMISKKIKKIKKFLKHLESIQMKKVKNNVFWKNLKIIQCSCVSWNEHFLIITKKSKTIDFQLLDILKQDDIILSKESLSEIILTLTS